MNSDAMDSELSSPTKDGDGYQYLEPFSPPGVEMIVFDEGSEQAAIKKRARRLSEEINLPSSASIKLPASPSFPQSTSSIPGAPDTPGADFKKPFPSPIELDLLSHQDLPKECQGFPGKPLPKAPMRAPTGLEIWTWFLSLLPILKWIAPYDWRKHGNGDLLTGITLGIILVPQGMAYAQLANLPPIYGLYAVIAPSLVYAILGTSHHLSVGPFAIISLLVASAVSPLADSDNDTDTYVEYVLLLSLLVGVVLLIMRVFRLGIVVSFLSEPVLYAFTTASAILIGASQFQHLFGISIPQSIFPVLVYNIFAKLKDINYKAFLLGIFGVALMMGLQKINQKYRKGKIPIPAALVLVVLSTGFQYLAQLDVEIVGDVPSGFPGIWLPVMPADRLSALLPSSITIAVIAYVLTISVAKQIARKLKYTVDANQELLALAFCNIFGALTYAYPSCCSLSRSTIAMTTNPGTQMHGLITTVVIVVVVMALTQTLVYLPSACLASIVFVAVEGMIDFKEPRRLYGVSKQDFLMWQLTFWSTLMFDVVPGIAIAVSVSLLLLMKDTMNPRTVILGRIEGTDLFWDSATSLYAVKLIPEIRIIRFYSSIHFANKEYFEHLILCLLGIEKDPVIPFEDSVRTVIVDASCWSDIDSSGLGMLITTAQELRGRNVQLLFAGLEGPVLDIFQTNKDLLTHVPASHRFVTLKGALDFAKKNTTAGTLTIPLPMITPTPINETKYTEPMPVAKVLTVNEDPRTY